MGPLFAALEDYDAWFTALRREQSAVARQPAGGRAVQAAERQDDPARQLRWRRGPTKDVWAYAKAHDIPLLPLYELGYTSIGCEPCTSLPLDPNNPRSGRWQGQKLECGIHIQAK